MKKLLLTAALVASPLVIVPLSAIAAPTSTTFNYSGAAQTFNVPSGTSSVTIEARGAQGGAVTGNSPNPPGGLGTTMVGTFAVSGGDVLTVVVGGRGNPDPSSSGGGGGSGVSRSGTPLIVAGGGAGVDFQDPTFAGQNAVVTTTGNTGNGGGGAGGTGGAAGGDYVYSPTETSRGGKGWNNGSSGSTGQNGTSSNTTFTNGTFGLGGGGGSVGYGFCNCGGGGGGYSGGGSGAPNTSGGGGGSFNSGTSQQNTAGNNTGNGLVIITYEASAPTTPVQPVPTLGFPALLLIATMVSIAGILCLRRRA